MPYSVGDGGGAAPWYPQLTSDYSVGSDGSRTLSTSGLPSGSPFQSMLMELAKRYMSNLSRPSSAAAEPRRYLFSRGAPPSQINRQPYDHGRENTRSMVERAAQMEAYNALANGFDEQYDDGPETRYGGSFGSESSIAPVQMPQMNSTGSGSGSGYASRPPSTPAGQAAAALTAATPKPPASPSPSADGSAPSPAPASPAPASGAAQASATADSTQPYQQFVGTDPQALAQVEALRRLRQRQQMGNA
jgi:hypothetical protein